MKSALNSRRSIEERFKIVLMDFFTSFPSMATIQLDPKRIFDNDQKIQIYARDHKRCQSCKKTVGEFDWHADHVVAWIRGGKTTMENGQVLCVKCNLKKKDRLW
jgi:5-methylcytosine-specific restriction endonuclease McrA